MNSSEPTPTVRKITPDRGVKLADRLRRKAQAIVEKQSPQLWESSPRSLIARQLALTLEELERAEEAHRRLKLGLLRAECNLDAVLMQPHGAGERLRIQSQLLTLEARRRELSLQEQERLSELTHRLLELVNRYVHVSPGDDRG